MTKREKIKAALRKVRKALAGAAAAATVAVLHKIGVVVPIDEVQYLIDTAIVTLSVYFAPKNVKDVLEDNDE